MNNTLALESVTGRLPRRLTAGLIGVGVVATVFIAVAALPYFNLAAQQWNRYWPRRWWLLVHISTGTVALLSGPVQLWLGLAARRGNLHRRLGIIYMSSVTVSALSAYYLALHTDFGLVFGAGLTGLATAWLLTTGLAFVAVRRRFYDQHKEWMIRSYVVTTAFITFRAFFNMLGYVGAGTTVERLSLLAWFCWAVPLLMTEVALQGKKMVRR
jgi:hypothetical protein